MPPRAELKRLPRYPKHQPIVSQTKECPAVGGGGGRAWGRDEGGEVGAWSSGGGGGLGRQDTMRQETVRSRTGMHSTERSETSCAWVRYSGKFSNEPVGPLTAGSQCKSLLTLV